MRKAQPIQLKEEQTQKLQKLARSGRTPQRLAQRCRIVLLAAEGMDNTQIGAALGMTRQKAGRWRQRYVKAGLPALMHDKPGRGRPARISAQKKTAVVRRSLEQTPADATQWSTRVMAKASDMGPSSVRKIWREHGLKPHLARGFKLSNDKRFVEKLEDIVGLYLNAPEHALVLSCDEKSRIQALDRSQPGLPLREGKVRSQTHDYKRHGTTTLFAALSMAGGQSHQHMPQTPPPSGMAEVFAAHRRTDAPGHATAFDRR